MSERREVELRSRVPPKADGSALVDYLAARFRYLDAAAWRTAIERHAVTRNDAPCTPDDRLRAGDEIAYRAPYAEPEVPDDLRLVRDAETFAVLDKPAGLPCHADGAFIVNTLVQRAPTVLGIDRILIVHRLDRETSGLVVVAKTRAASRNLHAQFAARSVDKLYRVRVCGVVAADRLVADAPIGLARDSIVSMRRAAHGVDARPARTDFEVLEREADTTVLHARPQTGRPHQIRVHAEALGHPVVDDKLYGRSDEEFIAWVRSVKTGAAPGPYHALHAERLAFDDPETGVRLEFESQRGLRL